jgi:hypothetical protein
VSKAPETSTEKRITYFFFQDRTNPLSIKSYADSPGIIDENAHTIHVILPHGTGVTNLYPMISILGKSVYRRNGNADAPVDSFDFSSAGSEGTPAIYRVYDEEGNSQDYSVTVDVAGNGEKDITQFAVDGYLGRIVTGTANGFGNIDSLPNSDGYYHINLKLPYGVSLTNLTPLIQYKGVKLEPGSGTAQNFSAPVHYTVTDENKDTKPYKVILTNDGPDTDTGIFDFVITQLTIQKFDYELGPPEKEEIPAKTYTGNTPARVVIGQKPRADGKIPIVIQVPYHTDERALIPVITLTSASSTISSNPPPTPVPVPGAIPFGNAGNPQEAVYTVTSQGGAAKQDYVVVVSAGGQYLYVNGVTGDNGVDYYQGMSEDRPYQTLAYAVERAAGEPGIDHIFVTGELNAGNQESETNPSVITLDGTGDKSITVTGTGSGATLRGDSGKRVLSVTGGSKLVFENITVTGGNSDGNGGGIYIGGNSKVKFSGGSITGNKAVSGGGVYVEGPKDDSTTAPFSEFTLMGGIISGNTATGNSTGLADMGGGGGVYVKDNATFWLAAGTVSGNTATRGAGGGVLVNGHVVPDANPQDSIEYGFLMSGGTISDNRAPAGVYPHGGGGVYVAQGAFDMQGGSITGNYSNRQGGGVFVHWGLARFTASGNSLITGNDGVGSSKAICNRGTTELMGNAQADTIYVWNYDEDEPPTNDADVQSFTLGGNARIGGLVLAHSAHNRNYLTIAPDGVTGSDQICRIDLEGHLVGSGFAPNNLTGDWVGKKLVTGNFSSILNRLPLGSFTGTKTENLANYKINSSGELVKK